MNEYPILVGYDRSRPATAALSWAQREAARSGAPVRLVYVYEWSSPAVPVPARAGWPDRAVRREAAAAIEQAAAAAGAARPEVPVSGLVVDGTVVSTLSDLSRHARLLVVGDRGLGGFSGLLAGSVAMGVACHARCPIVVVRGTAPARQPIVVGVDSSPDSEQAIGFAFDEAARRGVGLLAVRAWPPPPVPHCTDTIAPPYDPAGFADLAAAQGRLADAALAGWQEKYPQVPARVHLVASSAGDALIAVSSDAQLVVVGAQGRGGSGGLPLGSVAQQLLQYARCPVAIIRATVG